MSRELRALVKLGQRVVEDFLPNVGVCALQDYGALNDFMIQASKVQVENNPGEAEQIESIIKQLTDIDCDLSEIVSDYQTRAEAGPGFSSYLNADDVPICPPEDANPDLDGVRVHIDEAQNELKAYLERLNEK